MRSSDSVNPLVLPAFSGVGLAVLLFSNLAGCSRRPREDTAERLRRTIRAVEEHSSQAPPAVLRELKAATPDSLRTPRLLYVWAARQPKAPLLLLEWIESHPTATGVLVREGDTGYRRRFIFGTDYRDLNAKSSQLGVLFRYTHAFGPDSVAWREFREVVGNGQAKAVLLRQGQPVSNEVSVELRENASAIDSRTDADGARRASGSPGAGAQCGAS